MIHPKIKTSNNNTFYGPRHYTNVYYVMVIKQHSLEKSNNVYREKNYWPYFHSGPRMKCTLYFFLSFRKCYDNYLNFLCLQTLYLFFAIDILQTGYQTNIIDYLTYTTNRKMKHENTRAKYFCY